MAKDNLQNMWKTRDCKTKIERICSLFLSSISHYLNEKLKIGLKEKRKRMFPYSVQPEFQHGSPVTFLVCSSNYFIDIPKSALHKKPKPSPPTPKPLISELKCRYALTTRIVILLDLY